MTIPGELDGRLVLPGDVLFTPSHLSTFSSPDCGPGCYLHPKTKVIHASVAGFASITSSSIAVHSKSHTQLVDQIILPKSVVICRVVKVTPSYASLDILYNNATRLRCVNSGMIRIDDLTSVTTEEPDMLDSFRIGDIVKARVLSLGDAKCYYLSTAEVDLGVVQARSEITGELLKPISHKEMGKGDRRELRKVASPAIPK